MHRFQRRVSILLVALACVSGGAAAQAPSGPALSAATAQWPSALREVPPGQRVRLHEVSAPPGLSGSLSLTRFEVVAPDARLVVNGPQGPRSVPYPDRRFFRGRIEGEPGSLVVLSVGADGQVRGVGRTAGGHLALAATPGSRLVMSRVDVATAGKPFSCGNEALAAPPDDGLASSSLDARAITAAADGATAYQARIAIETDHEFYLKFGNVQDAADYVTDLVAYASTLYADEVSTSIVLSHLSLWTDAADPWSQTGASCALYEFGKYWNDNNSGVERTMAHFLSGKSTNAGVAWLGVLCRSPFDVSIGGSCPGLGAERDNYGGDYGFSGGLDANFTVDNPNVVWDIVAFTHELGHNFDSPHTHCYAGIGGNASDVDQCYGSQNGCYSGATSLPLGCGGARQGCGTLMSYCHLLSGNMANLSLTLGLDSPYGVAPERVPSRMFDHVARRAAANPSCIVTVPAVAASLSGPASVVEGDVYEATLTLSQPAASAVTVDLAVGPALQGRVGNLAGHVIAAGGTELTVSLSTVENALDEPDARDTLYIEAVTGADNVGVGSPSSLELTLVDDDAPAPVVATLGLAGATVGEGGSMEATVTLDQATTVDVEVSLALDAALAAETSSSLGPRTIGAGATSTVFTLVFDDDDLATGDRSGNVSIASLASAAAASTGEPASAPLTLVDDEVRLSIAGGGAFTEGEPVTVELVLDRAIDAAVDVELSASPAFGEAISGLAGRVIPAGSASLVVELPTAQNDTYDGDLEGAVGILTASSAGRTVLSGAPQEVPVTLRDDEPPSVVLTLAGDSRVDEGQPVHLTVSLDRATTVDVWVTLDADPALPLAAEPGPHRVAAGETSLDLAWPTVPDGDSTLDVTGTIRLASVTGDAAATFGSPASVEVTVVDVDGGMLFGNGFETP